MYVYHCKVHHALVHYTLLHYTLVHHTLVHVGVILTSRFVLKRLCAHCIASSRCPAKLCFISSALFKTSNCGSIMELMQKGEEDPCLVTMVIEDQHVCGMLVSPPLDNVTLW